MMMLLRCSRWSSTTALTFATRCGSTNASRLSDTMSSVHVCRSLKEGIHQLDVCFYSSHSSTHVTSFKELCQVATSRRNLAMEQIFCRWRSSQPNAPHSVLEFVEDLPHWILRACPLSVAVKCSGELMEGGGQLKSENDVIEYFVNVWLERFVFSSVNSTEEYIPVLLLLGALTSFRRWTEGVACDSGRLVLRPLHGMYCPNTMHEERAYQPLLHWLQDDGARLGAGSNVIELCGGCNGGYVTDMLLKGGATSLLCAGGRSLVSSASTELAVKGHWRQKRSSRAGRKVTLMDLPTNESLPIAASVSKDNTRGELGNVRKQDVGKVSEAHAAERRRRARCHRSGLMLDASSSNSSSENELLSPISLLCYHPLSGASLIPKLLALQHGVGLDPSGLLPCLENGTDDAIVTESSLHTFLRNVRGACDTSLFGPQSYLALFLPSHFDVPSRHGSSPCAAEIARRELSPLFEQRVHSRQTFPNESQRLIKSSSFQRFLRSAVKTPLMQQKVAKEMEQWFAEEYSVDFLLMQRNPLSFAASLQSSQNGANSEGSTQMTMPAAKLQWQDTFQYDNYLPKKGPPNTLHWSAEMDQYNYLDYPTQQQGGAAAVRGLSPEARQQLLLERNNPCGVLQGAECQPLVASSDAAQNDNSKKPPSLNMPAAVNLRALFSPEARTARQRRMQKYAFASHAKREWFLDEKFVNSEAAKVEVLSELLVKFDIPEPQ